MKRFLLALALLLLPAAASAQCNGTFPNNTVCGNVTGGANLPRPTAPSAFLGAAGGTNGQIQYNNSGALGGFGPITGDIALTVPGAVSTIQPNAVTTGKILNNNVVNAKLLAGAANTYKGSTDGVNTTDIGITTLPSAICVASPSQCTAVYGYTYAGWYGAVCDGKYFSTLNAAVATTNISITSGTKALTSSGSNFTSADVGKSIWVPGAGPAGAGLSSTITAFTDATHVTINDAASTTVTAVAATPTAPFVYGTNNTTALQAAMNGTPSGGELRLPPGGCLIKQQGVNTFALLQNHPFSITGSGGKLSTLMTDPSMGSTIDALYIDGTVGLDWQGTRWTNFSIADPPAFLPTVLTMLQRHGRRGMAFVDNASFPFINITLANLTIGESGNDHSVYIGNPVSSASTNNLITNNSIWGGLRLSLTSDSFRITNNRFLGSSTFGGQFEFVGGSGGFYFTGNNVTWAGGTNFLGAGVLHYIVGNYFEELFATSEVNNAMVDFSGSTSTINSPIFEGNIVGAIVSSTSTPVRYANVTNGTFGKNYIITSTARTGVISTTQLSCSGPSTWVGVGMHFSTTLASPNPFTC